MTHTISFQTGALANAMADAVNAGQALTLSVEQMRGLLADVNAVIVERDALRDALSNIREGVEGNRGICQDCESIAIVTTAALDGDA